MIAAVRSNQGVSLATTTHRQEIALGPDVTLSCRNIDIASQNAFIARLTETAQSAMQTSCQARDVLQARGEPIYGVTTGFGPFVAFGPASNDTNNEAHGASLLAHLGAGWGPSGCEWSPPEIVRAAMLIRAQNLAQGKSAVAPRVVQSYLRLPENDIVPCVPSVGSVGASGDLVPLAHIARALSGAKDAQVWLKGKPMPAPAALALTGLSPLALSGRDALSLTNGTSFLTAYAARAIARAERLLGYAERLTGWLYRQLGARATALDARLHEVRGHRGQCLSADSISREAFRFGAFEANDRALQEVYSIRCAPQILGACHENLEFARRIVETEINGVSDNPVFLDGNLPRVLHGGNFHGQQVAFAADALNAALTQIGVLAERQIDALVTPSRTNGNAPLLLAPSPGATSGLAGAQITATSLVAEMRSRAQMHATFSIPTNGDNQDVVSMGHLAARAAYEQTDRLSGILAILAMSIAQLDYLRRSGIATGQTTPPPPWLPEWVPLSEDRALHGDIQRIAAHFLQRDL